MEMYRIHLFFGLKGLAWVMLISVIFLNSAVAVSSSISLWREGYGDVVLFFAWLVFIPTGCLFAPLLFERRLREYPVGTVAFLEIEDFESFFDPKDLSCEVFPVWQKRTSLAKAFREDEDFGDNNARSSFPRKGEFRRFPDDYPVKRIRPY